MSAKWIARWLPQAVPLLIASWIIYATVKYPYDMAMYTAVGIGNGAIYALIAIGFGLIYNTTHMINFAHGEVFMMAAVTSVFLLVDMGNAESTTARNLILFVVIYLFSIGFGAGLSVASDRLVFRRLRPGLKLAPLIASIGVALIFQNIGLKINGSGTNEFNPVLPDKPIYVTLTSALQQTGMVLAFTLPVIIGVLIYIVKSANGRAIRAVSDDADTASLMGVNVDRIIVIVFAIAGGCAGAAGIVYAQQAQELTYHIGLDIGLIGYASAIVGGVGRTQGAILGGFLIGIVQSLNAWIPSGMGHKWSETVIYSIFILMLVYKPEGLWGIKERNSQ